MNMILFKAPVTQPGIWKILFEYSLSLLKMCVCVRERLVGTLREGKRWLDGRGGELIQTCKSWRKVSGVLYLEARFGKWLYRCIQMVEN